MTFAEIALKNAGKKFRSYLVYFISTAFCVMIFELFCAMYLNPAFENYRFGSGKMSVLFKASAVAVLLFAVVFVLYSASYFLKVQKKEIAIYSLLGMRRGRIAAMMFSETFIIGLLSIVCGVALGCLFSGYAASLLLRVMAEGTDVSFSLNPGAAAITAAAFCSIFAVSGLRAYRVIYRYSLSELFSAEKQSEGAPKVSYWGGTAALAFLLAGYGVSVLMDIGRNGLQLLKPCFVVAGLVLVGTYLLFRNLVPLMLSALKRRKQLYYRCSNIICISQISFRMRNNYRLLSVVSILTAITVTLVATSYSFYRIIGGDGTEAYAPYSYLAKNISESQREKILRTVQERGEIELISEDRIELVKVSVQNDCYAVKDQQTGEAHPGQSANSYVMSESMYMKIIEETHTPRGRFCETATDFSGGLDDDSCFFIDGNAVGDYCRELAGKKMNVEYRDTTEEYIVTDVSLHKYIGVLDLYKCPTVVLSDANYQKYLDTAAHSDTDVFYGFQFDDDMCSGPTVDAINGFIEPRFHIGGLPGNISYIGIYKANFALFGSYAFIGFFLGVLFLLACGSVMYYKLIMEAEEEAPRYALLRKMGLKRFEAAASVRKQLALVYGMPLLVGLIHTAFGLGLYIRILGEMSEQTPALGTALTVVLLYAAAYGAFYLLCAGSYLRIVWRRQES